MISYGHLSDFFKSDFLFHIHFSVVWTCSDSVVFVFLIFSTPTGIGNISPLGVLLPRTKIIWLSNILALSVAGGSYS
jgi:hypothetical protein